MSLTEYTIVGQQLFSISSLKIFVYWLSSCIAVEICCQPNYNIFVNILSFWLFLFFSDILQFHIGASRDLYVCVCVFPVLGFGVLHCYGLNVGVPTKFIC